jgi:hypothetical protein
MSTELRTLRDAFEYLDTHASARLRAMHCPGGWGTTINGTEAPAWYLADAPEIVAEFNALAARGAELTGGATGPDAWQSWLDQLVRAGYGRHAGELSRYSGADPVPQNFRITSIEDVCCASVRYLLLLEAGCPAARALPTNGSGGLPAKRAALAAERKSRLAAYVREVELATGQRITKTMFWRAAGYTERSEFHRWQSGDERTTQQAIRKFAHILDRKPHLTMKREP